jgi:hypothetical protein
LPLGNPSAEEMRIRHFSELDFVVQSPLLNILLVDLVGIPIQNTLVVHDEVDLPPEIREVFFVTIFGLVGLPFVIVTVSGPAYDLFNIQGQSFCPSSFLEEGCCVHFPRHKHRVLDARRLSILFHVSTGIGAQIQS